MPNAPTLDYHPPSMLQMGLQDLEILDPPLLQAGRFWLCVGPPASGRTTLVRYLIAHRLPPAFRVVDVASWSEILDAMLLRRVHEEHLHLILVLRNRRFLWDLLDHRTANVTVFVISNSMKDAPSGAVVLFGRGSSELEREKLYDFCWSDMNASVDAAVARLGAFEFLACDGDEGRMYDTFRAPHA